MKKLERQRLIEHVTQRITGLEMTISNDESLAIKKLEQSGDAAANMDLTIQSVVNNKVMQEHQKELPQLKRSLAWLNSKNAGNCEQCGTEVPIARLMAVLDSRLCLSCAETNNI